MEWCHHDWTNWELKSRTIKSSGGYYEVSWWERRCRRCGIVEANDEQKKVIQ